MLVRGIACRVPITRVPLTEPAFKIPLLSWNHDTGDHRGRGDKRGHHPNATDPERNPELRDKEREIDGIAAETIWPRPDDVRRWLVPRRRGAGGAERAY